MGAGVLFYMGKRYCIMALHADEMERRWRTVLSTISFSQKFAVAASYASQWAEMQPL